MYSSIFILISCLGTDSEKGFKEANHLYNIINKNTTCELVEILDFSLVNGKSKNLTFKLVGCEFKDYQIEADRINKVFRDSIDYFCDIKLVSYNFINKNNSNVVKYYNCNKL